MKRWRSIPKGNPSSAPRFYKRIGTSSSRKIQLQEVWPRPRSRCLEVRRNQTKRKRYCHASDFECRKAPARPLADGAISQIPHHRCAKIPDVEDAGISLEAYPRTFQSGRLGAAIYFMKTKNQKFYMYYFASNKLLKPAIRIGT